MAEMEPKTDTSGATTQAGGEANSRTSPVPADEKSNEKGLNWKQKLLRWTLLVFGVLLLLFFLFRWTGTSHHRGTVERVYEKGHEYRVEFWDESGKVHVVGNEDLRFPYLKLNTADLHAQLNRLAKTGDLVELKVWGFRYTWLSMFPNAISVQTLESGRARAERRAGDLAEAIEAELKNRGALKEGAEVREAIVEAIVRVQRGSGSTQRDKKEAQ